MFLLHEVVHEAIDSLDAGVGGGQVDNSDLSFPAGQFHHALPGELATLEVVAADVCGDHLADLRAFHFHVEGKDGNSCIEGVFDAICHR